MEHTQGLRSLGGTGSRLLGTQAEGHPLPPGSQDPSSCPPLSGNHSVLSGDKKGRLRRTTRMRENNSCLQAPPCGSRRAASQKRSLELYFRLHLQHLSLFPALAVLRAPRRQQPSCAGGGQRKPQAWTVSPLFASGWNEDWPRDVSSLTALSLAPPPTPSGRPASSASAL